MKRCVSVRESDVWGVVRAKKFLLEKFRAASFNDETNRDFLHPLIAGPHARAAGTVPTEELG
jgi:hypothetical protein